MQLATKGQFWKVYLNHYGYIITTGTLEFFYLECVFQMEISSKPPFVRLHLYKLQQILFQLTTTNYSKICSLGMFKSDNLPLNITKISDILFDFQ